MGSKKYSGFSLVEMAMVMLIIGVVMAIALPLSSTMIDSSNRATTTTKEQAVQQALINFVTQNKRLPCPADGAIPDGAVGAGVEARNGNGDCVVTGVAGPLGQLRGVVPWVTLGISASDAQDGWNNRITYRVPSGGAGMTRNNALDLTGCDTAGTGNGQVGAVTTCTTAGVCAAATLNFCVSPLAFITHDNNWGVANRGLQVSDSAGNCLFDPITTTTGAAYVLISHGTNRAGAYSPTGALIPAAGANPPPSNMEQTNANGQGIYAPAAGCAGAYFNAQFSEGATANHFDDIVLAQSIMNLVVAAGLGPRAH